MVCIQGRNPFLFKANVFADDSGADGGAGSFALTMNSFDSWCDGGSAAVSRGDVIVAFGGCWRRNVETWSVSRRSDEFVGCACETARRGSGAGSRSVSETWSCQDGRDH